MLQRYTPNENEFYNFVDFGVVVRAANKQLWIKAAQVASLHKARHNGGGYEYNAFKYDCLIEIRYDAGYKSWPIFCLNIYNKLLEEFF